MALILGAVLDPDDLTHHAKNCEFCRQVFNKDWDGLPCKCGNRRARHVVGHPHPVIDKESRLITCVGYVVSVETLLSQLTFIEKSLR